MHYGKIQNVGQELVSMNQLLTGFSRCVCSSQKVELAGPGFMQTKRAHIYHC